MGGQGKWKARGERNREKTWSGRSQNTSYTRPTVPTPLSYPRQFQTRPVPSEIGEGTIRHIYDILSGLTLRVRNLEQSISRIPEVEVHSRTYRGSEPKLERVNTVPRVRRLHEFSEGKCRCCRRPLDFTSSCSRQQEVEKNFITIGIQTESPYLSRTIDVTQCRYCSS